MVKYISVQPAGKGVNVVIERASCGYRHYTNITPASRLRLGRAMHRSTRTIIHLDDTPIRIAGFYGKYE